MTTNTRAQEALDEIRAKRLTVSELTTLANALWDDVKLARQQAARDVVRNAQVGDHMRIIPGSLKSSQHDGKVYPVAQVNRTRLVLKVGQQRINFPGSTLEPTTDPITG